MRVSIGMLNDDEARQVRLSTQYAGNLVAIARVPGHTGLSWDQAFAAISSGPAEAIGLGSEIGSLRPGRRGDVVIWDGDPLELATGVEAVWIDGVRQSLENRQTRLRDRYRQPQEGALPHAYTPRTPTAVTPTVSLALATLAFVGTHLAMSHPLRPALVARLGERGFLGAYSLISFVTLGWMIFAWRGTDAGRAALDRAVMVVAGRLRADAGREHPAGRLAASAIRPSRIPAPRRAQIAAAARRLRDHPPSDEHELHPLGVGPHLAVGQRPQPDRRRRHPGPRRARHARPGPEEGAAARRGLARLAAADLDPAVRRAGERHARAGAMPFRAGSR